MTKELVCLGSDASPTRVYERWSENFWPDLFALWKLWVPATAMNFAFSPMWMRIPVVASTSLIWTCILSSMRGGDETADEVNAEVVHESNEERGGVVMLGSGGVDARAAELFAQGLARRVTVFDEHLPAERNASSRRSPRCCSVLQEDGAPFATCSSRRHRVDAAEIGGTRSS